MAESLGKAWKDLNDLLEKRRQILQKNYSTQGHIQVKVVYRYKKRTKSLKRRPCRFSEI